MAFTPAQVKVFANAGPRIEHLDDQGGGFITRTFYVEPYIAYPYVETLLKGTVVDTGGGIWGRVKPHKDPIKDWFYCSDVQVRPFSPDNITGMALAPFTPSNDYNVRVDGSGGQQTQINNVLNCVDDHSYGNIVDFAASPPIPNAAIAAGGIPYPNDHTSTGKCGAYITATYTPLIFLDGIPGSADQFDYVNPKWTPIEVNTQVGRDLFFYSPAGNFSDIVTPIGAPPTIQLQGGLLDTFSRPELIWQLDITRLMVPFLPSKTLGALNNKINATNTSLGNADAPLRTVRFISPQPPPLCRAPDGATYYNITYKYLFRKLWEEYFDPATFNAAPGFYPTGVLKGWVDWNHHFGVPSARLWPNESTTSASYYPVCWNGGLFQLFGTNHPLYLDDNTLDATHPPGTSAPFNLLSTEFGVGFKAGQ